MEAKVKLRDFGRFDLAVVGGGSTGVCAAVRAARLGLRVCIIEKSNCFGGVATNGLVNVWHTLYDTQIQEKIIGGITQEIEDILLKEGAAVTVNSASTGILFDPNVMKHTMDALVKGSGIKIFFHTYYLSTVVEENKIKSIIVANKDGMGSISADFYIDSSGDGDICRDVGLEKYTSKAMQPPTPGCFINGNTNTSIRKLITEHGSEFGLDSDWGWGIYVPGLENIFFRADFHLFGKDCSIAQDLTAAEIEGREKIYALMSLIKKYDNPKCRVVATCSHIGIRETAHYKTLFKANERDILLGTRYEDVVMKGSYRVDVHHNEEGAITFKYLDGRRITEYGEPQKKDVGNWREEEGIEGEPATHYEVPFRILVQDKISNLIPVGRMLNADEGAFGALRVMVNLNQLGEAAGAAAYLAIKEGKAVFELSGKDVRNTLINAGVTELI